ncbi:uncharacterized protein LOC131225018 [Magnolia sinica]|uniref:uncharacterized protein LOC131225018 n=1 Tax=Magnolia sinica TaxID=86752 RepID=UPI0026593F9D|nr:uncharacterized protein LOC131225018 [Magnolia sinica]
MYWKQKSMINWLEEGDRDTKFFHTTATERQRRAMITCIELMSGEVLTDPADIKREAIRHFKELFKGRTSPVNSNLLDLVPPLVTQEMNDFLMAPPSIQEVKSVIQSIPSDSAPGPNGFSGVFYSACWDIIGKDIHKAVVYFFQGGKLPQAVNSSLICLVPKGTAPRKWSDFHPISLCNCIYKIFSKIIAVRLSQFLPSLISQEQGAFIKGWAISENIALSQELFRVINRKTRGGNVVLKLDMKKVYDKVDWAFLKQVLTRFGFSSKWVNIVENCWASCWFSVLINGEVMGFFKSSCGLRQGDPLSPSLFILGAEVLSQGLKHMVSIGSCAPFTLRRGCPQVSHLLYADDTLLLVNGGRLKSSAFQPLVDKVGGRIRGWRARLLSQAGRLVLTKHVLGSIPIHTLAATILPKQVMSELERCFASFFGDGQTESSLWASFVAAKYCFNQESSVDGVSAGRGSPFWKKIMSLQPFLQTKVLGSSGLLPPSVALSLLPQETIDYISQRGFCLTVGPDTPLWPFTTTGNFLVKSAWDASRPLAPRKGWARWVWHRNLLPKISPFLWRLLHNDVPVEKAIQSRGVPLASKCVCCRDGYDQGPTVESIPHLLLDGQLASSVWGYFGVQFRISIRPAAMVEARITQWKRVYSDSRGHSESYLLVPAYILWELWKSRNGAIFDDKEPSPQSVVSWQKPPNGWVKVNVDGSSRGNPGLSGGGGVCRNDKGDFLFGFAFGYGVMSNIGAEIRAAHDGLLLCIEKGFSKVVVESDSELVIKVFNEDANIG